MRKYLSFLCASLIVALSSATAHSQTGDFKWGNVMMGGGGFVSAIITSKTEKNVIYARTDVGGAYRWNEAGKSWVPITDWLTPELTDLFGVDAIALDPQNSSRVYMFAGTGYWNQDRSKTMILRSDNYGETFDTINVTDQFKTNGNGMGRQNGERLAVDPNNPNVLFCGTRNDGLWKSINRGTTWTKVESAPTLRNDLGICLVLFDPNRTAGGVTTRIYIGLSRDSDNFYVSNDAGATWESVPIVTGRSRTVMPQRAVLTPGGKYLYVATAAYAGPHGNGASRGALMRYDTDAKTWANISPENLLDDPTGDGGWGAYLGGVGGVSISAADSNFIVASTINGWKPQIWEGTGRKAWGDKIYASKDGGTTWIPVFGDYADGYDASGNEPAALLYKNGFNWIEGESIHWTGSLEIDPFDPKRVWATSGNGIYMADDFKPGEQFRFNFMVRGIEETVPLDVISIPGGPLITVIMDYDGFVHHDITKPVLGSRHDPRIGNTHGLDFAKLRPNVVVKVGGDDKQASHDDYRFPLHYSQDTGRTWTKFGTHPGPGQNYAGKIAVSSDGRVVVWAPQERGVLHRTSDWGATWTQAATSLYRNPFPHADPVDPAVFYAFGRGVHRSNDTGKTFTQVTTTVTGPHGSREPDWTNDMRLTPGVKGHIWIVGHAWDGVNGGYLTRSTDGGVTFHDVDPAIDAKYTQRIQHAEAVGFGKAAPGEDYPAIYIYGTIGGVRGIWQSIDEAKSWTRIDDEKHAFGALANGNFVRGDMNTFGVVYRSTAGRGIAARMPASWLDDQTSSVRQKVTVKSRLSPHVRLRGEVLTLTPPNGNAFTVNVYDLKGRRLFNKTYTSSVTLRSGDMVRSKGSYIVTVRNAAKETVFSGKLAVIKN